MAVGLVLVAVSTTAAAVLVGILPLEDVVVTTTGQA
jgi:hypothetical protein